MKRFGMALLAAVLLCTGVPARAVGPYVIDAVLPLTGPNAFVGNEERQALEVLQAAVNRGGGVKGRAIRFEVVDSQSSPQIAVQLTNQILANHPSIVIGDSALSTCAAMAPLLAGGPLQFCLSPGFGPPPDGTSYVIGASPELQAAAIVRYALARGWTRMAMLNQNDATGDSVQRSMLGVLAKPENAAMHVVAIERFAPSDISIAAQLARIRAADAQLILSYNSGAPFGIVVRGLRDAGIDLPVFTSPGNLSYVELKAYGASLPRRLFFSSGPLPPDGPGLENGPLKATDLAYLDAFHRVGIRPDWGHAVAWDTGAVIVTALRARGLEASPAELAAYINGLHGLPAVQGIIDFRNGWRRGVLDARVLAWDPARDTWAIVSDPGGIPRSRP